MKIVVAPNAFKNSCSAEEAAQALGEGLRDALSDVEIITFPIGDGGDGTGSLLMQYLNAEKRNVQTVDPLLRPIQTSYGFVSATKTAIIEMANASGLRLLQKSEYAPLHATSFGTGELIRHAIHGHARKVLLCIGGSATVDGAFGILIALGARFLDEKKNEITNLLTLYEGVDSIDLSAINSAVYETEIVILCDVLNPLLGQHGAAATFGPQKGADQPTVQILERGLIRLAEVIHKQTRVDITAIRYGGAAGGVSAVLSALLNAKLVNGIDFFLGEAKFNEALNNTDLVITGEGSIDEQTLQGKGPFGVAVRAREHNIPVIGVAGQVPLQPSEELKSYFNALLPINNEAVTLEKAMTTTRENLVRTGEIIGKFLQLQKRKEAQR